ncbi:TPA: phage tail tape measure protein [Clostridium perfringens]|uniref:phage tail tape measure protein n=1 Tax=Clostridium perfringens TaxID=1502 RepID=UPI00115884BC|nr:phage tail tape measure protein [Clostridium perfringens]EHA6440808.1 phage tail tape measure protein [Clostridium perfringens]MDM0967769.1 phage tail tape measure protein [Clostridium perfringens]MEA5270396.1 phage tail tape measure protein [Clostridium perfringens]MEA5310577.1 phage tail tape measure protein [Clostridium perfringens]MEA5340830.1 phage tail tape measure protein [Clostridium perfringens]
MAANIKIGANSSDFQKQMKQMAQELKKVSSSYNLANTQAKLFGNQTDLLKSRQSELTSKIKIQNKMIEAQGNYLKKLNSDLDKQKSTQKELADKIELTNKKYKESVEATGKSSKESKELAKELKELKEDYAKNDKAIESNIYKLNNAETKLNNSKKALLENEKALKDVNKELEKSKLDKFSEGIGKAGEKAEKISDKMKPASVAITGFGTAAAMASIGFEESMAKVSTIADDTEVPLDDLKAGIMNLSNQTGISSDEIANNVYDAISAGQKTGDAVNFVSNSTKLAKAGFAEAGQSLDILTTILNSYGMKASEVTKVSDTLIQTQNLGKVTVGELSSDMGKVIPTAKSLGVNLSQVASGYAIMTAKGVKSAETTTYMNSMLNELGKSGTVASKALQSATGKTFPELIKNGKSVGDVLNSMDEYAKKNKKSLSDMFGSAEAGKAALLLSENGGKDFNNMLKQMNDSSGATEKAFKKMSSTTQYSLTAALNQGKNALIGFGDVIAPFVSLVAQGLSKVTTLFNKMSLGQKKLVVGFGASFVGANLLLSGFSKLATGIKSNIEFTKNMIKTTKNGVGAIKNFANGIKNVTNALGIFKKGITNGIKSIGSFSKNLVATTTQGIKNFGKGIVNVTKSLGKFTLELIKSAGKGLVALGKGLLNGIKTMANFTKAIALNTAQGIKNGAVWVANKAKMIAYKVAQIAVTGATKAMTLAQKALNLALSMNPIGIVITLLVALATTFITLYTKCEWFRNGVNSVWSSIKSIFSGFSSFFKGVFSRDWTQTFGLLGVPINSFLNQTKSIINGVKGVFNGLITFFKGVFTGNWRMAFQGLANVVKSIFGTMGAIIKSPINAAISGINMAIRGVNKLSFDIPDWVPGLGGKHFGIHIPQIPALAEGGIVTKATMALVGEGKEHEAVIPLSKLDSLVTNSVKKVIGSGNKNNIEVIVDRIVEKLIIALSQVEHISDIKIDGRRLARIIAPLVNEELARI